MVTPYHIKVAPAAHRQLKKMSAQTRKQFIKFIESLAINPRPPGCKKIPGMTGLYSQDAQQARLIYKIEQQEILLLLIK